MSNNNEKWDEYINQSFKYPEGLSGVENRLERRIKTENRKKRAIFGSISTVAASFIFVLLVNTSVAFAGIVSEIPLIGQLAEYVKFDKGLKSAIENDYVQEVNLVSWDGTEKLLLPYVIADEKNLVLFFKLPEEDFNQEANEWASISTIDIVDKTSGEKVEEFSYSTSSLSLEAREENYGLIMLDCHFSEDTLPNSIEIEVVLQKEIIGKQEEKILNVGESIADLSEHELKKTGTFKFDIELEEFGEPKIYELNEKYTIMGQQIIVKDMAVYPTGTEITFEFPAENTAWIKGLDLEVMLDNGEVLKGSSGISAYNDIENRWMRVFIESNYFEKTEKQELLIKGIRLLDKDKEFITVDLDNQTILPEIEKTVLKNVVKRDNKINLVFSTEILNSDGFGMFNHDYKDIEGNDYFMREQGQSVTDNQMTTYITVEYPESGKIILKRSLTPIQTLTEPIKIEIE